MSLRFDLRIIADLIEPGSRVLDLGCGEGELLVHLQNEKRIIGRGIEEKEERVAVCIEKGLSVLQGDLNREIEDYVDQAFDYVVLSQTLQQVYAPAQLLASLVRIGKKVVVSFPNFSHWRSRLQLLFTGHAPKTRQLPYEWYDTPNIRVVTINDFRKFAHDSGYAILREIAIYSDDEKEDGRIVQRLPNLRASYGIMLIARKNTP